MSSDKHRQLAIDSKGMCPAKTIVTSLQLLQAFRALLAGIASATQRRAPVRERLSVRLCVCASVRLCLCVPVYVRARVISAKHVLCWRADPRYAGDRGGSTHASLRDNRRQEAPKRGLKTTTTSNNTTRSCVDGYAPFRPRWRTLDSS